MNQYNIKLMHQIQKNFFLALNSTYVQLALFTLLAVSGWAYEGGGAGIGGLGSGF